MPSHTHKRRRRRDAEVSSDDGEEDAEGEPALLRRAREERQELEDDALLRAADEFDREVTEAQDFSSLELKPDHEARPVWVAGDGRIFLETFSPLYKQAYDFLVAIAEPQSRPEVVHEYCLSKPALQSAVSVGLDGDSIVSVLSRLCKTALPPIVAAYIRKHTRTFGKAKIILFRGKHYIQTFEESVARRFLNDPIIGPARVLPTPGGDGAEKSGSDAGGSKPPTGATGEGIGVGALGDAHAGGPTWNVEGDGVTLAGGDDAVSDAAMMRSMTAALDEGTTDAGDLGDGANVDGTAGAAQKTYSFEVRSDAVEAIKQHCQKDLNYPLMEEYDFRADERNASIDMDLKPIARIRPYQEKSLSKMFGNGRARSGIIVLPCGAGKSLVGVTAACTVKKPTLCLCTSSVSVEQWRYQFALWSTLPKEKIGRFTAVGGVAGSGGGGKKDAPSFVGDVTVTTYHMLGNPNKRSAASMPVLEAMKNKEWGLMLLDEVHVVPANIFRKVLMSVNAHCKLGLTATLLREDNKIGDLVYLIGPKLYEANWLDLQRSGYLATVQCAEVWCPMTAEFFREYLSGTPGARKLLYAMNPNKIRACEFLVRFHEARKDKVIIFSDTLFALDEYARLLQRPFIRGDTPQAERLRILHLFQHTPMVNTILLSKVGDTSIDIPEANVLIQVSSHYGSRRQEAQRLGRILRPKPRAGQNFNAFFYSLVSTDTSEMYYAAKRQKFLTDQGYAFKVITHLEGLDASKDLRYSTREEQLELLASVLAADASAASATDALDEAVDVGERASVTRNKASMAALSGGAGREYAEFVRRGGTSAVANAMAKRVATRVSGVDVDAVMGRGVVRHALFRKRLGK
ncbi:hypothetical protein MMPV_009323 [Pyropia vietnamensis]